MEFFLIATLLIGGVFPGPTVVTDASEPDPALWFFWGSFFSENTIYNLTNAQDLLSDPKFNHNLPTVVYTHGWIETPDSESIQLVIGSYLERGGYNVLLLDWQYLASPFYTTAMDNVPGLGIRFGEILVHLFDNGLSCETFHFVGHSLGSHVAGFAGRTVISFSEGRYIFPRLTCLDPAGPLWYGNILAAPVNPNDAIMVDVIHTNSNLFGAPVSTGTVDFYPNGGFGIQPGCPSLDLTSLCSHQVSWRLWAEGLTAANQLTSFLAVQAGSWLQFTLGNFNDKVAIQMGINTPANAAGDWYLQTNGETPRSRNIGYNRIFGY